MNSVYVLIIVYLRLFDLKLISKRLTDVINRILLAFKKPLRIQFKSVLNYKFIMQCTVKHDKIIAIARS